MISLYKPSKVPSNDPGCQPEKHGGMSIFTFSHSDMEPQQIHTHTHTIYGIFNGTTESKHLHMLDATNLPGRLMLTLHGRFNTS